MKLVRITKVMLIVLVPLILVGCGMDDTWHCIDITSYDNDRNNDMKCTKHDGSIIYTSYEGAKALEKE